MLGVIRDRQRRPVAWIRDTITLNLGATQNVPQKSMQYQTSVELPPGQYLLKAVIVKLSEPPSALESGLYTCQINAVDDAGGSVP